MSETLLLPVSIYLIDSILNSIYPVNFLKEKYQRPVTFTALTVAGFIIQIIIFELFYKQIPDNKITKIILHICILVLLQFIFFIKDIPKQLFVVFSFVAGKEAIKYITSVFYIVSDCLCNKIFYYMVTNGIINKPENQLIFAKISDAAVSVFCALFYAVLFFTYLFLINRKFTRKDYILNKRENIFLLLPCIAALCVVATMGMMVISVKNGITIFIYNTVPATKFWIPLICILLLSAITASVILFQKLVQYYEERRKCLMLENQIHNMQKEIEEIQDIYASIRGLKHDLKNHLYNISILARNTKETSNKELENYTSQMEETLNRLDFACNTGNPVTDIIIHQKMQEAEKKHIQFESSFIFPQKSVINVYDTAIILDNALENAMEACCKQEKEGRVYLYSYTKGNLFFIEIINSFQGEIIINKKNGLPATNKKNNNLHGTGISNIQRCARKYMGGIDIETTCQDGKKTFRLTVMLNLKNSSLDINNKISRQ